MNTSPLKLLLNTYPFLTFDLEEYLMSTQYIEALRDRFNSYSMTTQGAAQSSLEKKIADAFESGQLDYVPYYKEQRAKGASFKTLPLIDKNTIRKYPDQFNSSATAGSLWRRASHGTTGRPVDVFCTNEYYFDILHLPLRKAAARFGLPEPMTNPVYAVGIGEAGNFVLADPTRGTGLYVELALDMTDSDSASRILRNIRDMNPAFVSSRPNLFSYILKQTKQGDLGHYRPIAVMSGGEVLLPRLRRQLEEFFECRAINRYGMSEVGLIASECSHGFLHIDTSAHHVEIVDDSGAPMTAGGVGHIVISNIQNDAMPLLQYKTGDIAAISLEPCRCGDASARFINFQGREIPNFALPTGQVFSPLLLTSELFRTFESVNDLQFVQAADRSLILSIEFDERVSAGEAEDALRSITRFATSLLPSKDLTLHCRSVRFFRDGKFKRYQSEWTRSEPGAGEK